MGVPRFECFCAKGLWVVRILPLTDNSCVQLISVNSYSFEKVDCLPVIWLVDNTINNFQIFLCRLLSFFVKRSVSKCIKSQEVVLFTRV